MVEPQIVVGARGARISATAGIAQSAGPISEMFDAALSDQGDMYYCTRPEHWIIVRNVPKISNERGETTREAQMIDCKFVRGLYLLRHDDPHFKEKKEKIEAQPTYGSEIKPMSEIVNANKARAQYEAVRVLSDIRSGHEARDIIAKLLPALDIDADNKEAIRQALGIEDKPEAEA